MGGNHTGRAYVRPGRYEAIHLPKNTAAGVIIAAFGLVLCFALVWHTWLLSFVGLAGAIGTFIVRSYERNVDYFVPAAEVERIEGALRATPGGGMTHPMTGDAHVHSEHLAHDRHDDSAKTTLGFWIYLMGDCLIIAVLFATFGVLVANTADGPAGRELFSLPFVLWETMLLLFSSFTFGVAMLSMHEGRRDSVVRWLRVTFILGAAFIGMELHEFSELLHKGAGPGVSAFLSSYFSLVGTHGIHVTVGLLWMAVMMHQVSRFGLDGVTRRRLPA